ncbi:MAG TPA: hypothetical protein VFG53_14475 [Anaeromyxobacter sp.]|nr:hypothetical protein [Anaeromyxobacter sp.]
MNVRERALLHQIHPAKLIVDVSGGLASTWLMWRHDLALALAFGLLPSVALSGAMLRWMRFEAERDSRLGRYIVRWMTPAMQWARLIGQAAVWVAAWAHSPLGIGAGLLTILFAWTYGLLPPWNSRGDV